MTIFWKGAAAISLAIAGLGATAMPAQAHPDVSYRDSWRGDRDHRWNDWRRNDRHWNDNRRHWHGSYRSHYRYRPRCWTEWRYDRYRHRDVRVRICR